MGGGEHEREEEEIDTNAPRFSTVLEQNIRRDRLCNFVLIPVMDQKQGGAEGKGRAKYMVRIMESQVKILRT